MQSSLTSIDQASVKKKLNKVVLLNEPKDKLTLNSQLPEPIEEEDENDLCDIDFDSMLQGKVISQPADSIAPKEEIKENQLVLPNEESDDYDQESELSIDY